MFLILQNTRACMLEHNGNRNASFHSVLQLHALKIEMQLSIPEPAFGRDNLLSGYKSHSIALSRADQQHVQVKMHKLI